MKTGTFFLPAATAAAFFTVAVATAEPIIVLLSQHNLDYAESACSSLMKDAAQNVVAGTEPGVIECKLETNTRALGRRLELEVEYKFAVNTRCKGVTVLRTNDREFDGKYNDNAIRIFNDTSKPHWNLLLDYYPGSKVHSWALQRGDNPFKGVQGEGTPAQIADEACIVVTGQGANIP